MIPTKPGFYWARWKINDGTIDAMFDTSSPNALWEVVEVYWRDETDEPDAWCVWLMGIPGTQPVENFFGVQVLLKNLQ